MRKKPSELDFEEYILHVDLRFLIAIKHHKTCVAPKNLQIIRKSLARILTSS